ncbi:hypothetical protein RRG08_066224 [Elysia crispata]|uniref:Uncharacterized protein n=1 Tax=Elysia crispata TaxID=231223 RepID=A0AAE1BD84_9GAST|nr:hypothetical protein RRG08_066224 [Elysia crispata]
MKVGSCEAEVSCCLHHYSRLERHSVGLTQVSARIQSFDSFDLNVGKRGLDTDARAIRSGDRAKIGLRVLSPGSIPQLNLSSWGGWWGAQASPCLPEITASVEMLHSARAALGWAETVDMRVYQRLSSREETEEERVKAGSEGCTSVLLVSSRGYRFS